MAIYVSIDAYCSAIPLVKPYPADNDAEPLDELDGIMPPEAYDLDAKPQQPSL